MSGFWTYNLFGARLWIWLLLLAVVLLFAGIVLWLNREKLYERWLKFRHPERAIKIVIHYPSGMYKAFWRKIPDRDTIELQDKKYKFDRKKMSVRQREDKNDMLTFMLNGHKHDFRPDQLITAKASRFPEIHYADDSVMPLDFINIEKGKLEVSAGEFKALQENDLWLQLLTMKDTIQQMSIIMILCVINTLGIVFIIAKMMGWLK